MKRLFTLTAASLLLAAFLFLPAGAQESTPTLLIPMGGGYSDLYDGLMQAVVQNAQEGQLNILVLPSTYSSDPMSITDGERQVNMQDAERWRFEVEEACKRNAPEGQTCSAVIAPVFTRTDAADPATLSLFSDSLSAIFILGGDQTVAMQALNATPLETRLEELFRQGVIFSGISAGCSMLSYNRSRVGRLLNAISQPGVPHIGIGVDAYTGVQIHNGNKVSDVFGLYDVAVFDAETYHAADGARYTVQPGQANSHIISMRNVLVHLLAQGDFSYDLSTREHSLGAPAARVERDISILTIPEGAGSLILSGDMGKSPADSPILARFLEIAGGENGNILIVSAGYPTARSAETNAGNFQEALGGIPVQALALDKNAAEPVEIPEDITCILFIGRDASLIDPVAVGPLEDAWLSGTPLLADNAAASVLGANYANYGPTPDEAELEELLTQKAFLKGILDIQPGLGLLDITVEPRTLQDNRWARLFSLAYSHPNMIAIGLNDGAAIEINHDGATALGENVIFSLDLSNAQLDLGTNQGYVIANGLMDVFTPGEPVSLETADVESNPQLQPTPLLPTPQPAPTATHPAPPPTLVPPTPADTMPPSLSVPQPQDEQQFPWLVGIIFLALGLLFGAWWIRHKQRG